MAKFVCKGGNVPCLTVKVQENIRCPLGGDCVAERATTLCLPDLRVDMAFNKNALGKGADLGVKVTKGVKHACNCLTKSELFAVFRPGGNGCIKVVSTQLFHSKHLGLLSKVILKDGRVLSARGKQGLYCSVIKVVCCVTNRNR